MAKKSLFTQSKNSPLSQLLIVLAVMVITAAVYEFVTGNDFTNVAPTQLFLVAGVLGVLGIYLKDEK
ncbi:MAG: hypothetical protein Q8P25_03785 [Candidatus Curtissbacteria bacterium]|nr:hypothetical protein [Candidatus Curtissbacteria bacterium]